MKGLPFIPEMAVAAIEGRKTQTRRIISPQPVPVSFGWELRGRAGAKSQWGEHIKNPLLAVSLCPYGKPGDRLCLLATWAVDKRSDYLKPTSLGDSACIDLSFGIESHFWHAGLGVAKPPQAGKSRPGRFLPNDMRRLMPVFEIVSVRVERVQDITEDDAGAEGCNWKPHPTKCTEASNRAVFRDLWNRINEKRGYGWASNPWVWVVAFRKV